MKFFVFGRSSLSDMYRSITEGKTPGPDEIDPAVKALIAAWEEKVSKTIRGARKLLRSQENSDPEVIRRYITLMELEASTIRGVCLPRTHAIYRKLIQAEDRLRLLARRLQTKIN